LVEAERIATASVPPGPHRLDALDRVLPALHRRIRRSAQAVHLLLTEGFAHEATILSRSLFEDSLKLGTLRRAGADRTRLLLGWMNESTNHAERILQEGVRSGDQDPADMREALRIRRQVLADEAQRLGIAGKLRTFGDERGMAKALDRLSQYHSYLYATQVTHGSESAFLFDPDPVGDTGIDTKAPNVEIAGVALGLAVVSVLLAHIDVAEMLNWPGVAEAAALLDAPLPTTQT
jgi:hypothetical protein